MKLAWRTIIWAKYNLSGFFLKFGSQVRTPNPTKNDESLPKAFCEIMLFSSGPSLSNSIFKISNWISSWNLRNSSEVNSLSRPKNLNETLLKYYITRYKPYLHSAMSRVSFYPDFRFGSLKKTFREGLVDFFLQAPFDRKTLDPCVGPCPSVDMVRPIYQHILWPS